MVTRYTDALWWAFMDVTTVGSNIYAVTATGKILSVVLAALSTIVLNSSASNVTISKSSIAFCTFTTRYNFSSLHNHDPDNRTAPGHKQYRP